MILALASFLIAVGFIAWILGSYFSYMEFAVIGGTIVILVGSMMGLGGLEYQDGATEVQVTNNTTEKQFEYRSVDPQTSFSLGNVVMLLGVAMVIRPMLKEGFE